TLNNATVAFNYAVGEGYDIFGGVAYGGGILNDFGTVTLNNATVSANRAEGLTSELGVSGQDDGGGILNDGTLTLTNATVSGNSAHIGGGIDNFGTLTARNTIIAGNAGDPLPGFIDANHNLIGGNPRLGPLQDNGGPTLTHALLPGSPA